MSSGKSSGQARSDIDTIRSEIAVANSSNDAEVARLADALTVATSDATESSSSGLPSWWIGAAGTPGSTSASIRRSTTSKSADAVTATAQPKW